MSENKKFSVEFKDGGIDLSLDTNKDGEAVLKGKLNLSEAIEEAIKRGAPVEGAKVAKFEFTGTKLILKIDTDRDGEAVFDLEIDLGEALDETGLLKSA